VKYDIKTIAIAAYRIVRVLAIIYFAVSVLGLLQAPREILCVSDGEGSLLCRIKLP